MTPTKPFAVVICGGGTAGIEALLRLRRLAGDSVEVTLLCPQEQLFYRPDAVLQPFTLRPMQPYPIARIAADTGARWLRDSLAWVDPANRAAHTATGVELAYDALLLAVGGRERTPPEHMDVFTDQGSATMYRGILEDIEAGRITQIAYVRPEQPSWPLPLYELALLTAQRAREVNAQLDIAFITREPEPLHAFGREAGQAVMQLFHDARIDLHTGADVTMPGPRHLILQPGGTQLYPDRTITLPTITGPNIRGIAGGALDRFLSIDAYCRVRHTDGRVFAAGDATDLPLKHGGVGAQQADTAAAAAGIAHLAGAAGPAVPLRPMIQGELLTASAPRYLSAHLIHDDRHADGSRSELYDQPPWLPDEELVAAELTPYLRSLRKGATTDQQRPDAAPAQSVARGKEWARLGGVTLRVVLGWGYHPSWGGAGLGSMFPLGYTSSGGGLGGGLGGARISAPIEPPPHRAQDVEADAAALATRVLDQTIRDAVEHDAGSAEQPVSITRAAIQGHGAKVLLDEVTGTDLLVVGSRGHGGSVGALLGSVSHHVVAQAPCPVVVVPDRQSEETQ